MSHPGDESEIVVVGPLELDHFVGVIFDGEVHAFFLFGDAVSEIYPVLLLQGQVLEQYLLIVGLALYPEPHRFELVQQRAPAYLPDLHSWLLRLELHIENSVAFGGE